MRQITEKVYYEKATCDVLVITTEYEYQGPIEAVGTKELDMQAYPELQCKAADEIDYKEIEYGTAYKVKACSINSETKQLEVIYYTVEELENMAKQNV